MKLTGGIIVYIIIKNKGQYYYGENSYWLLDDWKSEIDDGSYMKIVEKLKVDVSLFSEETAFDYRPHVIIDFDKREMYSSYFDQVLETHVPSNWNGHWIDDYEFLLEKIPIDDQYWRK